MGTTLSNGSTLCSGTISWPTPEKKMKQVKVAIFNVTRDENYEIIDSTFAQELWVCKKNSVSLEVATMKQLGFVIDPDKEVIKEILSVTL
jgi:hypothetical protein